MAAALPVVDAIIVASDDEAEVGVDWAQCELIVLPDVSATADAPTADAGPEQKRPRLAGEPTVPAASATHSRYAPSQYRGVHRWGSAWAERPFRVAVFVEGRRKYLPQSYATEVEAAHAFDDESRRLGRPEASLNFPRDVASAPRYKGVYRKQIKSRATSAHDAAEAGKECYCASIRIEGKTKHLGRFDTPVLAALAFDEAARAMQRGPAELNFPDVYDYSAVLAARRTRGPGRATPLTAQMDPAAAGTGGPPAAPLDAGTAAENATA